jgi:hypothetical protein
MRAGFSIDELVILCVGDFISGNIHKELEMTNEFSAPRQSVKAGGLLADLLQFLSPHFESVRVECQGADNHARLYPKPMAKGKAEHSYNVVVYSTMQDRCANLKNVAFNIPEGMKNVVLIQDTRFLTQHGDIVRGWMGTPHYGVERENNRERIKRQVIRKLGLDIDYDVMVIGHFHAFDWQERTIMNGSLSGTSEYDHACGRFALPHQISFLVHPTHGVHAFNRWNLP